VSASWGDIGGGCPCSPLHGTGDRSCSTGSSEETSALFLLLEGPVQKTFILRGCRQSGAFRHSAWLGGAWAFVAPGVCLLPVLHRRLHP
jgi:hypothetical protein